MQRLLQICIPKPRRQFALCGQQERHEATSYPNAAVDQVRAAPQAPHASKITCIHVLTAETMRNVKSVDQVLEEEAREAEQLSLVRTQQLRRGSHCRFRCAHLLRALFLGKATISSTSPAPSVASRPTACTRTSTSSSVSTASRSTLLRSGFS